MQRDENIAPRLLTVAAAAEYLGCREANVYGLIKAGILPYVCVGRRKGYRIDREDIDRFIEERKSQKCSAAPLSQRTPRLQLKHIRAPR